MLWPAILIRPVFIIVTGNGLPCVGWIHAIIVNSGELYVTVHEGHEALRIAIKRRIFFSGFAFMPGERSVSGPFHHEQGSLWIANGTGVFAGDIRNSRHMDSIKAIAAIIESGALAEWHRLFVASITGTGEHLVARR